MIFYLEVIKNKTFLPFQSFASFIKKKKKILENLVGIKQLSYLCRIIQKLGTRVRTFK